MNYIDFAALYSRNKQDEDLETRTIMTPGTIDYIAMGAAAQIRTGDQ